MKTPGYSGICAGCFNPIRTGDEKQFRPNGRKFCSCCFDKSGHYQRIEKRLLRKEMQLNVRAKK